MKLPQEQEKRETAGNAVGVLTALLLFICVLAVACFTWQKSVNPSATTSDLLSIFSRISGQTVKDASALYKFDIDSKENPTFCIYGDAIAECSSNGLLLLDKKGQIIWSQNKSLNDPIMKTNGSKLLIADLGSNDIFVVDGRKIAWSDALDQPILNADISDDGFVTVVTASQRYNNEIAVFDPYGNELFKNIIASDFVVNAGIAPDETTLAVSGISTGAEGACSNYKFYNDGKEMPANNLSTSGELLPLFWFNNNGSLFAAGDKAVAGMDRTGKLLWKKQLTTVMGACPAGDRRLAVAAEDSGGTQLKIYDFQGNETASSRLSFRPSRMLASNGVIAAYTDNTVNFFNDRARNISRYTTDSQIRLVTFFNRYQAAVVTNDSVTVININ